MSRHESLTPALLRPLARHAARRHQALPVGFDHLGEIACLSGASANGLDRADVTGDGPAWERRAQQRRRLARFFFAARKEGRVAADVR